MSEFNAETAVTARGDAAGRFARAAMMFLLAGSLGACSGLNFFGNSNDQPPDEAADRLYNEGLYYLNVKHEPKEAAKKFEEVDRQHPYSEWARKSLLMTSYAYYQSGSYEECVAAAQRYITLHPGNADAAYAQYLIGASYFDEIPDITRDQERTEKALSALEEVIRKYPTSEYAENAKQKIRVAQDQVAGKEMEIGRYYLNHKDYTGAINRFKVVVTKYQTTRHVEEAQTAAAVLGHNFPDSVWYKHAYTLVKTGGAEPSENQGSWISKAFKKVGLG